jgi:5-methylcytosine-specific restriction endonuclease McrA
VSESDIIKRLKLKVASYNTQDKTKGRLTYNDKYESWSSPLLTVGQVQDLIKRDGLECYYCNTTTTMMPVYRKDPNQFTLDRIDNNKTHRITNVKICCWQCNEERGADFTSSHFKQIKSRLQ